MGRWGGEAHAAYAVEEAFKWGEGSFTFTGSSRLEGKAVLDSRGTAKLILDGVRTIWNIYLVEDALGGAEGMVWPAARRSDEAVFLLSPVESYLLTKLDRPWSVDELCLSSPVGRADSLRGMYALICVGVVDAGMDPLQQDASDTNARDREGLPGVVMRFTGEEAEEPIAAPEEATMGLTGEKWRKAAAAIYEGTGAALTMDEALERKDGVPMDMARFHFEKGLEHYANEDYHAAVQLFRLAVKIDGGQAEYHRHLALALSRDPKWGKKAEQSLLRAVELEPDHAETHYFLGRFYLESGLQGRAMSRFRESLRINPDLKPARLELAVLNGAARATDRKPLSIDLLARKTS